MEKLMNVDVKGNNVNEGQWLVKDEGDIAWFYQMENEVPQLKANWMIGSLGLVNKKEVGKVEELELVSTKMEGFLNQLDQNGKAFWAMDGTLKNPRPYEQPYGVLKGE